MASSKGVLSSEEQIKCSRCPPPRVCREGDEDGDGDEDRLMETRNDVQGSSERQRAMERGREAKKQLREDRGRLVEKARTEAVRVWQAREAKEK